MNVYALGGGDPRVGATCFLHVDITVVPDAVYIPGNLVGMCFDNDFKVLSRIDNRCDVPVCIGYVVVCIWAYKVQPQLLPGTLVAAWRGIPDIAGQPFEVFLFNNCRPVMGHTGTFVKKHTSLRDFR